MKSQKFVALLESVAPLLERDRQRAIALVAEQIKSYPNTEMSELIERLRFLRQASDNETRTDSDVS